MPDQQQSEQAPDLSAKLDSSMGSVWARYVGSRPSSATTQIDGNVVRWILDGGTSEFEEGFAASQVDAAESDGPARTVIGYERETSAAVAKATGRRVLARMSKHDKKTGVATETFILEIPRKRY